jgi:hypothetical protein
VTPEKGIYTAMIAGFIISALGGSRFQIGGRKSNFVPACFLFLNKLSLMKVLSINVSLPKEVDWHGRKITTSIFKTPVEGRRHVGKLNIEGDGQSDLQAHGGEHRALFIYQKDSYDYWKKELGLAHLHYGQFGENLTVEGLPDNEVCIGDRSGSER